MKKSILGVLVATPLLFAQTQTFTYSYGGLPIPIYPDDWNTVAAITLLVPRSLLITKVTASVQVQFGGVGDLNVFMWSPGGTRTKLLERSCGSLTNIDTTFDDAAPTRYSDFCPTEAGRGPYRPTEPLSNSNGQNAFGYWRIGVENSGSGQTGTLNGFSITITGTPVGSPIIGANTIVSAASLQNGTTAPGDLIAVLGVNLGPTPGVRANASQPLPTSLGGTSVTFDGVAAPVFYAGSGLIAAQVPTSVAVGTATRVQVTSTFGTTTSVSLNVVPVKPSIVTYEAGGKGQAKAINQDGTPNGDGSIDPAHRTAAPGSVIAAFATGLGAVNPAIPAGTPNPATPLSTVVGTITASIGGRSAQVTYAGAAPGLIGTYQVNLLVPLGTPAGPQRVVLSAAGVSSQADAMIQVR